MTVSPPVFPGSPIGPAPPVEPVATLPPVAPVNPVEPVEPVSPLAPVAPVGPSGPGTGTVTTAGVTVLGFSQALKASAARTAEKMIEYFIGISFG